jgi:hypothetical protein
VPAPGTVQELGPGVPDLAAATFLVYVTVVVSPGDGFARRA